MTARDDIEAVAAEVLAGHDYAINDFGAAAKRDGKYLSNGAADPGWHGCRCGGWAGYWCDFRAHQAAVLADALAPTIAAREAAAEARGAKAVLDAVEALADSWVAADDTTQWGDHTRSRCGRELLAAARAAARGVEGGESE